MKVLKNKNLFSMIAVLLILSFVVSMFAIPNVNAQSDRATFPFVDAIPHVAGVGQPVLINWGLLNQLEKDGDGWNVTLQITDPNGKVRNETGMTWSTGTVGRKMSFMEPGNYTLQCIFDRAYYDAYTVSGVVSQFRGWYAASESETVTLQILPDHWKFDHPGHSLPDEYWTRPVDSQLREWQSIMGSWIRGASGTPHGTELYTNAKFNADAPDSAHILWTMPLGDTLGGLAGGDSGAIAYQNGDAYEGRFSGAVIIAGVLYYNRGGTYNQAASTAGTIPGTDGSTTGHQKYTIVAVDLHTGKTLWEKSYNFGLNNDARIQTGQVLTWLCLNNRGVFAYLWIGASNSGNLYAIEPATGELVYNMTNVPSGTIYFGPNGEMLKYRAINYGTEANPNWYLQQWNSSYVVNRGKIGMAESWGSQVQGVVYDADARGWDYNVSLSLSFIPGQSAITTQNPVQTSTPRVAFPEDIIVFSNASTAGIELTAFSIDPESFGSQHYSRRTWPAPSVWADIQPTASQNGWVSWSQEERVGIYWTKMNRVNYAFDIDTGKFLWETEPQIYADGWTDSPSYEKVIAYGKLYEASVGGIVYCYDIKTGEELWNYPVTDPYNESYHGENWWLIITFVTDGKVYMGHMTHSSQEPKARGAPFLALDAETGDVVWEIDGAFRQTRWGGRAIIGDSIMATMDTYDNRIYAVGKGPSEMTVSVSNAITSAGSTVLVTGTVMDVSPGTQSDDLQMRFSKGVPAVGDESMSEWMLYLYKHFSQPMSVTGIEITVYAWDGHQRIEIGTVESDARGTFSIAWTPEEEGDYDIWAYFEGTNSYFGSDAKADMKVLSAPEVIETKTPPYEWYIIGAAIAIIVVNILVTLLLRKK